MREGFLNRESLDWDYSVRGGLVTRAANILRWSGFRVLLVIKPLFIVIFLTVLNLLFGLLLWLNHGSGRVTGKKAEMVVVLIGVYLLLCALLPLLNERCRARCCRANIQFERAIVGLIQLGLVGLLLCIFGAYQLLF